MAPSAEAVTAMFTKFYGSGNFSMKDFEDALAPEHSLSVAGHDFVCSGSGQNVKEFATDVSGPIIKSVDPNKSVKYEVLSVVGAGSDTVAVEAKTTATTRNGKPWVNEAVSIVKFNGQDKIEKMKLYMDTQHIHEHVQAHA